MTTLTGRRRGRERTRCTAVGRLGPGSARRFECLDPEEAERLVQQGEASPVGGGDYDSEEECEARCSALTALPPELGTQIAGFVPVAGLGALARGTRLTSPEAQRELRLEREACDFLADFLAERYPALWRSLLEEEGTRVDWTSVNIVCREWGLPCRRPCSEIPARLAAGELVVPFGALLQVRRYMDDMGALASVIYNLDLDLYMPAESPTLRRAAARPAPIRGVLPWTRGLPVLFEGDSLRVADSPGGDRTFLYSMWLGSNLGFTVDANSGLIRMILTLMPAGTAADSRDFATAAFTVPPPPGISVKMLRGYLGVDVREQARVAYIRAIEALLGLPAGCMGVRWLGDVESGTKQCEPRMWEFFRENGFPVEILSRVWLDMQAAP